MPRRKSTKASLPITVSADEGFIRLPAILDLMPIGESSWWRGVADGRYPKPVRLAPRTVAWRVAEIRQLLATLATAPDQVSQ